MIITNKHIPVKSSIYLCNNKIEVVDNFKLLGILIDNKFSFHDYVKNLIKTVNAKLFSYKKMFYLSKNVKLQFFKSFIMPHFDYCVSLAIYYKI